MKYVIYHSLPFLTFFSFLPSSLGPRPGDSLTNVLTSDNPQSPPPGQNSSATNGGSTSSDGGEGDLGSDAEGRKKKGTKDK